MRFGRNKRGGGWVAGQLSDFAGDPVEASDLWVRFTVVSAWGPALGKVWEFIGPQPGLWTHGHNIFLYHHPTQPGAPILCDFGVEVTRTFEAAGQVYAAETPGGDAAVAVHRGPYNRMNETHNAIRKWMAANRREAAGLSCEIRGDPTPDPADTETTIVYLLRQRSRAPDE